MHPQLDGLARLDLCVSKGQVALELHLASTRQARHLRKKGAQGELNMRDYRRDAAVKGSLLEEEYHFFPRMYNNLSMHAIE